MSNNDIMNTIKHVLSQAKKSLKIDIFNQKIVEAKVTPQISRREGFFKLLNIM